MPMPWGISLRGGRRVAAMARAFSSGKTEDGLQRGRRRWGLAGSPICCDDRLFNFRQSLRLSVLPGAIASHRTLDPVSDRATLFVD